MATRVATVRLQSDLLRKVELIARYKGRTVSSEIADIVESSIEDRFDDATRMGVRAKLLEEIDLLDSLHSSGDTNGTRGAPRPA